MELNLNRRQFVAAGTVAAMGAMAGLAGCSSNDSKTDAKTDDKKVEAPEKLVFAWEPGASEGKYETCATSSPKRWPRERVCRASR